MAISKESNKAERRHSSAAGVVLTIIFILLAALPVSAQLTYYIQGLHRQPSAAAARAYLGIGAPGGFGTLASADFANQGTVTTVLHGNAAGNPYWDTVDLATEVNGNLAVTHLNNGTDADINHYWRGDGQWATIAAPAILDIRTNHFNYFLGTNQFNTNLYVMGNLGLSFTNFGAVQYSGFDFVYQRLPYVWPEFGALLGFSDHGMGVGAGWLKPNGNLPTQGVAVRAMADQVASSVDKTLILCGAPVMIGTSGGSEIPLAIYVAGNSVAQVNEYGNLLLGRGDASVLSLFGTLAGGIMATNFIHSARGYVRAYNGFVVNSNSWLKAAAFATPSSADAFNIGDVHIVSSNGFPMIKYRLYDGTTNELDLVHGLSPMPPPLGAWEFDGSNIYWSNSPPADVRIGDGVTWNIQLYTDGKANFVSNVTCKANLTVQRDAQFDSLVTCSNLLLSTPNWRDQIISGMALGAGASTPGTVVVGPTHDGLAIRGMGFAHGEDAHSACQLNHDIAPTNAALPAFYIEPHIHISSTDLSTGTNATFRMVYEWANIWGVYTNVAGALTNTVSFTNVYQHQMLEFGHITNNAAAGAISTTLRFGIERLNGGAGDMGNTRCVVVDSVDVHYPVWRLGSKNEASD